MVKKIVTHYKCVKEALTDGRHLTKTGYFADTKKFSDVWNKAIELGIKVTLPEVFVGDLVVYALSDLDATALAKVGGNLVVYESADLDATALAEVVGDLAVYASA